MRLKLSPSSFALGLAVCACTQQQPEPAVTSLRSGERTANTTASVHSPAMEHTGVAPVAAPPPSVSSSTIAEVGERPSNDVTFAGLTQEQSDAFLSRLKTAVERDDKAAVAAMISYPTELRLNGKGPLVLIHTPSQFVSKYHAIVTDRVRAELRAATPETVHANWQGVSTVRGAVWYNGVCEDPKCKKHDILVTRINNHAVPGKPPR
jgi:hypothetical protein